MTVEQFKERIRTIVKKVYVPKKEDTPMIDFEEFKTFPELKAVIIDLLTTDYGSFIASIDLKDAYYAIPVSIEYRKFLRFVWKDELFQFTCLPNGLSEAPRKFTKIMKVPFANLRAQGHDNSAYIDDSALLGKTFDDCMRNIECAASLLDALGFTIHPEKSVTTPTTTLEYLGFLLDSITMTVKPTRHKAEKIALLCQQTLGRNWVTVRELAEVIGNVVALHPGADFAPIYFRRLEIFKAHCLK